MAIFKVWLAILLALIFLIVNPQSSLADSESYRPEFSSQRKIYIQPEVKAIIDSRYLSERELLADLSGRSLNYYLVAAKSSDRYYGAEKELSLLLKTWNLNGTLADKTVVIAIVSDSSNPQLVSRAISVSKDLLPIYKSFDLDSVPQYLPKNYQASFLATIEAVDERYNRELLILSLVVLAGTVSIVAFLALAHSLIKSHKEKTEAEYKQQVETLEAWSALLERATSNIELVTSNIFDLTLADNNPNLLADYQDVTTLTYIGSKLLNELRLELKGSSLQGLLDHSIDILLFPDRKQVITPTQLFLRLETLLHRLQLH